MSVLSKAESLQILEQTLREQALQKCAAKLATADAGEKRKILSQIEKDVRRELRGHRDSFCCDSIIH